MTVVVGTAGHIDHGKTTLLRALTGIDADRLPEEQRRGMTIDVGYAHLDLADGTSLDFVDVPGHDRLVGNMLVGAGEIDAALLVVAADDGPRAQTLEHLELLDALGIARGVAVITKADLIPLADPRRAALIEEVRALLERTTLAGAPVLLVSSETGEGLDDARAALVRLRDSVVEASPSAAGSAGSAASAASGSRLAIDRVFGAKGRGTVVTGSLRGAPLETGMTVRIAPDGSEARIREIQVHGTKVERATGGRTALNLAGVAADALHRGMVLTTDPAVLATDRLLAALRRPADLVGRTRRQRERRWPPAGLAVRLHLGTEQVDASIDRGGPGAEPFPWGEAVVRVRLARAVAAASGDRFVLREPASGLVIAGGRVLDPRPPVGPSRRRETTERLAAVAQAEPTGGLPHALLDLHGAVSLDRWTAMAGRSGDPGAPSVGSLVLARDVLDGLAAATLATVDAHHAADPDSAGVPTGALRTAIALDLRRRVTAAPPESNAAATALIEGLVAAGRLARDGDRVRDPRRLEAVPPALATAMDRLVAALEVPAPPAFPDAVRSSACPPEGVRALERSGRIIRLAPDLAYAATTYRALGQRALAMAAERPLTPAAFRDATGTSRKYVMAILEDLDARGVLRRTPDGHVPGPRAATIGSP